MNHPDRFDKFVVPEDTEKISYIKDTKVANAATFDIQREDHTMGNLIRMQLHEDPNVHFAAYKVPHPLEYHMIVKVRTNGRKTPMEAFQGALTDLSLEISDIKNQFVAQADELMQHDGGVYDAATPLVADPYGQPTY